MKISNHPNPQFERKNFISLNGKWDFGFKKSERGFKFSEDFEKAIEVYNADDYNYQINVPFCVESVLSGIGYTGFINMVWYRKKISIKKDDKRIFLHIGAADNLTSVLVNGKPVGRHKGGYTSFKFDITDFVNDGENEIFILCEDDVKNPYVIRGKQSEKLKSHGCDYTRTTGIWQNVWLEYTPQSYIENFKIYPDINGYLTVVAKLSGKAKFSCKASYNGKPVGQAEIKSATGYCTLQVKLDEKHLWEPGKGRLYNLEINFGKDRVYSYFGLRSLRLDGMKFLINEKSVFQRLVLDQGFYKKGIYTAENDEELKQDIELSMALGFNGARLHQKVFDPRFLYYADMAGYLVWGEYANWGLDYSNPKSVDVFLNEWREAVERDFNHPSIVGWCPFNETWDYKGRKQYDKLLSTVYDYTKTVDITRPCIDTSGNFHVKTDIYDLHDYRYDPKEFKESYDRFVTENYLYEHVLIDNPGRQQYGGEPVFISEYGGIKWEADKKIKSWGYGEDVKTPDEFAQRYCGLTDAITQNEKMFGFCYTQLYDVEQEQNGLYTYERNRKFDDEIYKRIIESNTKKALVEKKG
ncbi:MAG: beta-galactosidase [Eubacterium sp.]|nr:beta-galactosidase [Eubacterium sp.]